MEEVPLDYMFDWWVWCFQQILVVASNIISRDFFGPTSQAGPIYIPVTATITIILYALVLSSEMIKRRFPNREPSWVEITMFMPRKLINSHSEYQATFVCFVLFLVSMVIANRFTFTSFWFTICIWIMFYFIFAFMKGVFNYVTDMELPPEKRYRMSAYEVFLSPFGGYFAMQRMFIEGTRMVYYAPNANNVDWNSYRI